MSPEPYRLGLTGFPLEHSLSPRLHAAALQACRLKGEYRLYPVLPGDEAGLQELLAGVRSGELHGLNVTIPHKRSVLSLLDEVSHTARAIGAVNTIYDRDGVLVGENTDAAGFKSDLERWIPVQEPGGVATQALVLGSGGSARAVVYALLQMGWYACVAARRMEQALELCGALADKRGRLSVLKLEGEVISQMLMERRIGLVVNATPLGMGGRAGESPWPEGVPLPDMAFVYDLVYNPPETALMQAAKEAGLRCTNGLGMLVEQARLAFTLWTGCEVEREAMERAV